MPQPATNFNFAVSMWDVSGPTLFGASRALSSAIQAVTSFVFAGFSEVSGLNSEIELETYQEGGRNASPRKLFKYGRFTNLTLKRGVTFTTDLADWYDSVLNGKDEITRKDGLIILLDRGAPLTGALPLGGMTRLPVAAWKFSGGLPERLQGPPLVAKGNEVAIETLEISHQGLERVALSAVPGLSAFVSGASALLSVSASF